MQAIKRLGGKHEESKIYSPKATHLIVEKMECTEKILCFIAAGKWIITHSYLKHSLRAGKFLTEEEFHVSFHRLDSKLASVSLKWQASIQENKKNAPFYDWNVGCYLEEEDKSKALIRIIKAGYGSASLATSRRSTTKFSLIIYDEKNREKANGFANELKVPCYPFTSIPDYIMLCTRGSAPILPISYYETNGLNDVLNATQNTNSSISIASDFKQSDEPSAEFMYEEFFALSSFKSLLTGINLAKIKIKLVDQEVESQFFVFWQNNATNEALNILISLSNDELPTERIFLTLFEFIMMGASRTNKNYLSDGNDENRFEAIYDSIYSFILNFILNHPPIDKSIIAYYDGVFKGLNLEKKIMSSKSLIEIKGLVDTFYLFCVHDYILISETKTEKVQLLLEKLDQDCVFNKLISLTGTKDQNLCYKLIEIVSFYDTFVNELALYCKLNRYVANFEKRKNSKIHDDDLEELFCYLTKK